jgi:MoxR-like ATPase
MKTNKIELQNTFENNKLEAASAFLESKLLGQKQVIRYCLAALVAEGHVLIESVPGLGKTTLAKGISEIISGKFSRIQMTSDLMPSDIIGFLKPTGNGFQLEFQKGPLFTNVLLADELNRTTPKTQSALLEAMAEYQVTIEGTSEQLDRPFFVILSWSVFTCGE